MSPRGRQELGAAAALATCCLTLLLLCGPAHARRLTHTPSNPKPLGRLLQQSSSSCWGSMSCLDPSYSAANLTADPSSLSGAPPLDTSAAGAIFSVFSTTSLTSTAALTVRGGETCPLLVLTGEQFGQLSELASQGGNINNFYPSDVGSGVKACANVAPVLAASESYILGVAAWDMPKPTAGEPDPGKAQKQVSMLGSSMAICAAINPCDDAYVFGFDGVSVTIPVSEEPPVDLTLSLSTVGYSANASNLLLPAKGVWDYSGGGQGTTSDVSFESNILVGGSADLALGLATPDGTKVATLDVTGSLRLGIDLDPAHDGSGGSDFAFAISISGSPSITLMDTLTLDLSGMISTELDLIWTYISPDNFKFQMSLTESFELDALFASVTFLQDALKALLDAKGTAAMDLYVDQNQAAIFLDLKGEIDVLPVLDIPPIQGELGVIMSVGYGGTADDFDFALVINGELYCLSSYGRGAGSPLDACPAGTVQDPTGLLCYPPCNAGYSMVGPVCWQDCPASFDDEGAFCGKPDAYWRDSYDPDDYCPDYCSDDGWGGAYAACQAAHPEGCDDDGFYVYAKCTEGFYEFGCCVCSPDCPAGMDDIGVSCAKDSYGNGWGEAMTCGQGEEQNGLLCYPTCREGYTGVGPVCWKVC